MSRVFTFALALALSAVGTVALAQQPDPSQEGVQLQMPDQAARPQPTGLVPQLRLGGVDDTTADDAIDDAIDDEEFLEDEGGWGDDDWGDDDEWGDDWDDEGALDGADDEAFAEPDALDETALHAEGEAAHEHGDGDHEHGAGAEHEAEHAEFDGMEFLATVVNFLLWLAIVVYLARKPLAEFLKSRRLSVEEGLVEAKQLKEAAEAKYDDYTERLEHLDQELESLREEMINAAETERDRIIEEAEARAVRMRKDAQFVVDQQIKQLRTDLTRETIEAAVSAAEMVLTEQVQSTDQSRLADGYLENLDESMTDDEVRA